MLLCAKDAIVYLVVVVAEEEGAAEAFAVIWRKQKFQRAQVYTLMKVYEKRNIIKHTIQLHTQKVAKVRSKNGQKTRTKLCAHWHVRFSSNLPPAAAGNLILSMQCENAKNRNESN